MVPHKAARHTRICFILKIEGDLQRSVHACTNVSGEKVQVALNIITNAASAQRLLAQSGLCLQLLDACHQS